MVSDKNTLDVFPAFFKIAGKTVVIVGGGDEAAAKLRLLSETSAKLTVVAATPSQLMLELISQTGAELFDRPFTFEDLADAALVFTAQETKELDRHVVEAARMVGVPVNAVDRPDLCDFITPSIVNRAPVVVAVSTDGTAPVHARRIKGSIEKLLPATTGGLAVIAKRFRSVVEGANLMDRGRRLFWEQFFDGAPAQYGFAGDIHAAEKAAHALLGEQKSSQFNQGFISLVGAGPGAEDLLTLRAHQLLQNADVVMHDALVPAEIVRMSRRDAEIISVGKRKGCHSKSQLEISNLLVEKAKAGLKVVRLKAGDPMIFGRAAEEIAALRAADIDYEIVPGVTAALAGAAEAEIPLTLRGTASSVVFTTGHDLKGGILPDWGHLALSGSTVAVYMGRTVARQTASRLLDAGLSADTPVAVLENIARHDAKRQAGTLADLQALSDEKSNEAAALIVIGEAVAGILLDKTTPLKTANPTSISLLEEGLAA